MKDFYDLAGATSEEMFLQGFALLEKKWKPINPNFMTYFEDQWIKKHPAWYTGSSEPGFVKTNNGAESFNAKLKKTYLYRLKLPPSEFVTTMSQLFRDESVKYRNLNAIIWFPKKISDKLLTATGKTHYYQSYEELDELNFLIESSDYNNLQQVSDTYFKKKMFIKRIFKN